MSLKNQAQDAGLTRSPALSLGIGEAVIIVVPLQKPARYFKTHKVDTFTKIKCSGDGCQLCAVGAKPRELWLVEVLEEDQTDGTLRPRALFLGRQEFGQLAEVLPDEGLNCRVRVSGVGAVDKDGNAVTAKGGARAGQQYSNMEFQRV